MEPHSSPGQGQSRNYHDPEYARALCIAVRDCSAGISTASSDSSCRSRPSDTITNATALNSSSSSYQSWTVTGSTCCS